jgi:eukaryotic-like serine/threonine-protein kinase
MSDSANKAKSIFLAALEDHTPEQWPAFLQQACAGDAPLRAEVEKLLRARSELGSFHESPAQGLPSPFAEEGLGVRGLAATMDDPISERPGTVIGPYKLLEQIGEGGFGVVFMAEQTQPVRRKVALKILKPGMDTRQVVARFEAERQALAIMDHPNIAKVLDGGQTASGRPYFVMDLVKGLPITDYCDQAQLTTRERLELFVQVCQAVQHAHQKGVIHRDLKPSNVLVMVNDTVPVVKVIDFGVAKALGQELTDKTLFTGFAQMVGTPLYMSPEQAGQSGVDVDTRSDIYSLGVVLYELLTGTTPFEKERLKEVGYDELRRIIREEEPPRPSTRISTLGQAATTVSTQRKSDPKRLSQLFRGELDWIVMKCLEKDRNRRYETASALAADVQCYFHDEPVLACPPSAWYRLRKYARRKKTALAIAACVLVALAGIGGGIGWAVRDRSAREERLEGERVAREEALDRSVEATLNETRPLIDQGKWPEALAAVERAEQLLAAAGRTERPARLLELRSDLMMAERLEVIYRAPKRGRQGTVILSSGHGSESAVPAQPGYALEEEFFWGREQDAEFARAFRDFGIDVEALAPAEVAAQISHRSVRAALIKALDDWAPLRKRARGDNDPLWKKLVEIARQADPDPWRTRCREALLRHDRKALEQLADMVSIRQVSPATLNTLGMTLKEVGALDKAMDLLRRAQQVYPEDLWLNDTLALFSWTAFQPPRWDDALRYYTAVLALRPRFAPIHKAVANAWKAKGALQDAAVEYSLALELDPRDALTWNERGVLYGDSGQGDKAIADFSKAIELNPKYALAWNNRGTVYRKLDQYEKAIADSSQAIALDPNFARAWKNRGNAYSNLRQYDKALADLSKAIALDPKDSSAWNNRGCAYLELHQYDRALADLNKAIALDPKNAHAWNNRGQVHNELHQYDQALADCSQAIALDPKFALAWNNHALAYGGLSQHNKALADLNKAIEVDPKCAYAWSNRGSAYTHLHQYDRAIPAFSKAIALDSKIPAAWRGRGFAYNELHQYDKGIADYSKAIDLDPKNAAAWTERGYAYCKLHQYDKGIADSTKAIELNLKNAHAWNNRGYAYSQLHQYEKAVADFSQALELAPKDYGIWSDRGLCYLNLHQYEKAIADFSKAIDLNSKNALAWNNRGYAYSQLHQYDKAIADCAQAIKLDPKLSAAWANRATAHGELDRWQKAAADLTKVTELDQNNVSAWYLRAVLALKLGDHNAYHQVCRVMLDSFGDASPAVARLGAWTCTLGPECGVELGRVVKLAEKLAAQNAKNRSDQTTLGAALYRAGRFQDAVRQLDKAAALPADPSQAVEYTWFFLAMAHQRLDHSREARQWLDRARKPPEPKRKDADLPWNRRLTVQLLSGEAEALLGAKDEKTPQQDTTHRKKKS